MSTPTPAPSLDGVEVEIAKEFGFRFGPPSRRGPASVARETSVPEERARSRRRRDRQLYGAACACFRTGLGLATG